MCVSWVTHSQRAQLENRAFCWVGLCTGWVVFGEVVPSEVRSSARRGEVSTAAAHASGRPPSVFLASPPSKACAMRSPTSSEHACPTSGLLCGRLLVALVESVLRPGGWENVCRLMCHCVRHINPNNKHGRSVKAIHSSRHAGRLARSSVPAHRKSRAARRARWGARTVRFSGVT